MENYPPLRTRLSGEKLNDDLFSRKQRLRLYSKYQRLGAFLDPQHKTMILFFQNETALKMTAAVPVGKTMTICKHCGKDIEDPRTTTCIKDYIEYQDGLTLPRKPFDDNENERCPVCHVIRGAFHHKGCYVERCPRCGQRLVSCGCLIKGKEWRQP